MVTLWWIYRIQTRIQWIGFHGNIFTGNHRFSPFSDHGAFRFRFSLTSTNPLTKKKAQGLWENPVLTWTFHIAQPTGDIICPTNTCLTVIFEIPKTGRGDQPNLWRIAVLLGKWRKMIRNHGIQGQDLWGNPPIIPEESFGKQQCSSDFLQYKWTQNHLISSNDEMLLVDAWGLYDVVCWKKSSLGMFTFLKRK